MWYKLPNNLYITSHGDCGASLSAFAEPQVLHCGGYTAAGHGQRSQCIHLYTTFMSPNRAIQLSVALLPLFEMTEDAITASQKMWYIVQVKAYEAECRTGWGRWARAEWSPISLHASWAFTCTMYHYLQGMSAWDLSRCMYTIVHTSCPSHTHTYLPPCHQQNWHLGAQESWLLQDTLQSWYSVLSLYIYIEYYVGKLFAKQLCRSFH